jgi:hypothetical protein
MPPEDVVGNGDVLPSDLDPNHSIVIPKINSPGIVCRDKVRVGESRDAVARHTGIVKPRDVQAAASYAIFRGCR